MGFIEGTDRNQTRFWSLEDMVDDTSMARVIDRFVDILDLEGLGFARTTPAALGRRPYSPAMMTRLFVYGYQNGIRSSRKLEAEAKRNVEVMWLTENLRPDHKVISEFRRNNTEPLKRLFKEFVKLCRHGDLIGGELMACDGTKIKASNNKKNNYSQKKLKRLLRRIDENIESYMAHLDDGDGIAGDITHESAESLNILLERRDLYETFMARLEASGENEISTVDPDARLMGNSRGGVEMAFNVQSAVDDKHHLIVEHGVTANPSDHGQLSVMTGKLIAEGFKDFTMLADKGYYNGEDLAKIEGLGDKGINAVVARQKPSNPKGQPPMFHKENFKYDRTADSYTCPMGGILTTRSKEGAKRRSYTNKPACAGCPHNKDCTTGKGGYRSVTRGQHADIYDRADKAYEDNLELYRRRQQLVEHPFGTIKHAMNGGHFLLRTIPKVECETALLCLAYNMKRAYNVLGFHRMMELLDEMGQSKATKGGLSCGFIRYLSKKQNPGLFRLVFVG